MLFRQVYLTFAVMCDAMLKVSALLCYCLCIDFSIVFLVVAFSHGLLKLSNILIYRSVMTHVSGRDVVKTRTLSLLRAVLAYHAGGDWLAWELTTNQHSG